MEDKLFDVAIVGDGAEASVLYNQMLAEVSNLSVSLVTLPIIHVDYVHGMHVLTLVDESVVFCKNIVIATGINFEKLPTKANGVFYTLDELLSANPVKIEPIVLVGNGDRVAKDAVKLLSKKFQHIYICTKEKFECSKKLLDKINDGRAHVAVLQFSGITAYKTDKNNNLKEVKLDTYDSIHCQYLVGYTAEIPNIQKWLLSYFELSGNGCIKVLENQESTKVPGVFAIGRVCGDKLATKPMRNRLIEAIKQRGV